MIDYEDLAEIKQHALSGDQEELMEALTRAHLILQAEDVGWRSIFGGFSNSEEVEGPNLKQVKDTSTVIREESVGNPLIKRGLALRASYVFSKGMNIPGWEFSPTAGGRVPSKGRPSNKAKFFNNPVNRKYLWSTEAQFELENAAGTDGVIVAMGDNRTKEVRVLPLSEIKNVAVNPEFPSEVVAYLREFVRNDGKKQVTEKYWIYVDWYTGPKQDEISEVPVDKTKTAFDMQFNSKTGWAFGVPDAMAATAWSKIYSELVNDGRAMTRVMAKYALTLKGKKRATMTAAGAQIDGAQAGSVAAMGSDMDMSALATAGKTYDFEGLRPIAAMVATALEVSVIHLLSDPGAAGSSYGSAQNLDLPTKRAIVARQKLWASFYERVILWGIGEEVRVSFPSLEDPDLYREGQTTALMLATGLVHPEEARPRVLKVGQFEEIRDVADIPAGYVGPNGSDTATAASAASVDQGRDSAAGAMDSTSANQGKIDK